MCIVHSKCQVPLPPLCREIEMPYFFKNASEKRKLFLQKKKEIHDTNLASFPSDISRHSAFRPNIPSLPATLCCPLSSTAPSELHTDVWRWKSCPLEIMPCIVNSGVPPSKYCAWHVMKPQHIYRMNSSAASVYWPLNFLCIESICQ